jgi:predicted Zn-dependent protease
VPAWASTHPDPASRVRAAFARAGAGAGAAGATNRDAFLRSIDGVMYGDDPKQGIVEGRKFIHPDMRLSFEAPSGYYLVNGTRAVTIGGQSGKGEFSTGAYNGNLEAYVGAVFAALSPEGQAAITPASFQRRTVNGIPAAYGLARVQSSNGQVDVAVFAYEFSKNQAFHFMTISAAGSAAQFNPMYSSVRRISASEAAAVRPRKLLVYTVRSGDTLQSLAARMAYGDAALDRFLVLNGMDASSRLTVGQKVKLITY